MKTSSNVDVYRRGQFQLMCPEYCLLEGLTSLLNDAQLAEWLGGARSVESVRTAIEDERIHWSIYGFGPWVVVEKASPRSVIGRGGIRRAHVLGNPEVELFYAVHPAYWRQGIGSLIVHAALDLGFHVANLPSIVVFTMPDNAASLRLIRKFGFIQEKAFEHAGLPHLLFRLHRTDHEQHVTRR